jgi:hypothetical protein
MEQTSWETVPMIWEQTLDWKGDQPAVVENNFVGGYTELLKTFEGDSKDD